MDDAWRVVTEFPVSPLTLVLALWACAVVCHARRRTRWAAALGGAGLATLWICATPAAAKVLEEALMRRAPPLAIEATPSADAIVLLGGALQSPRSSPTGQFIETAASDRIWHAAALYRAGKVPVIVVSAGPEPPADAQHPAEAHAIADLLVARGGVPRSAIRLETRSKNTRENATFSRQLIQEMGARRILLVTSPSHMARAMQTFTRIWRPGDPLIVASSPRPSSMGGLYEARSWFPTGSALLDVTKCMKEFAGSIALDII